MRVLSVCLLTGIVLVGTFNVNGRKLLGRAACFSVAAAAPDGFLGLFQGDNYDVGRLMFYDLPCVESVKSPVNSNEGQSQTVVNAVTKTVLGNIIKQTLTPYTANSVFGSVYVNNQCGESVDIGALLNGDLSFDISSEGQPRVLIYHTHATEGYMESESLYYKDTDEPRSTDCEKNVVKVGEVIAEKLISAGFGVIHDKTLHDEPSFSGSYSRSAETVNAVLKKYPSIVIAIDVHRDSILGNKGDRVAPVVSIDGRDAAQVMLVMGSNTGAVTDHPKWRENLKLGVKLQNCFETSYPQFARALLLKSSRYNQNLTTGSILIEVGSDANTLEQAIYSAELVGESLVKLLNTV